MTANGAVQSTSPLCAHTAQRTSRSSCRSEQHLPHRITLVGESASTSVQGRNPASRHRQAQRTWKHTRQLREWDAPAKLSPACSDVGRVSPAATTTASTTARLRVGHGSLRLRPRFRGLGSSHTASIGTTPQTIASRMCSVHCGLLARHEPLLREHNRKLKRTPKLSFCPGFVRAKAKASRGVTDGTPCWAPPWGCRRVAVQARDVLGGLGLCCRGHSDARAIMLLLHSAHGLVSLVEARSRNRPRLPAGFLIGQLNFRRLQGARRAC